MKRAFYSNDRGCKYSEGFKYSKKYIFRVGDDVRIDRNASLINKYKAEKENSNNYEDNLYLIIIYDRDKSI